MAEEMTLLQMTSRVANTISNIKADSLPERTASTRLSPIVLIDDRSVAIDRTLVTALLQTMLSVYAANYLLAVNMELAVGDVKVLRILDQFSTDRSLVTSVGNSRWWGSESIDPRATSLPKIGINHYETINENNRSFLSEKRIAQESINIGNEGFLDKKYRPDTKFLEKHPFIYYPITEDQVKKIPYELNSSTYLHDRLDYSLFFKEYAQHANPDYKPSFLSLSGMKKAVATWNNHGKNFVGYIKIPTENFEIAETRLIFQGLLYGSHKFHFDYKCMKLIKPFKVTEYKEIGDLGEESLGIEKNNDFLDEYFSNKTTETSKNDKDRSVQRTSDLAEKVQYDKTFKSILDKTDLVVGKQLEVRFRANDRDVTIPVIITLVPKVIQSEDYIKINENSAVDTTIFGRWHQWRSGEIRFVQDYLLCQDLIKKDKDAMIADKTGTLGNIKSKRTKNILAAVISGDASPNAVSAMVIITKQTAKDLEFVIKGKLSSPTVRDRYFNGNSTMMLVVVDPTYERFTMYLRGIADPCEYTLDDIKSNGTKANGVDINDVLKFYKMGSAPTL